jgi:hypothetical protein
MPHQLWTFEVSERDRVELERRVRSQTAPVRMVEWAWIVLLLMPAIRVITIRSFLSSSNELQGISEGSVAHCVWQLWHAQNEKCVGGWRGTSGSGCIYADVGEFDELVEAFLDYYSSGDCGW